MEPAVMKIVFIGDHRTGKSSIMLRYSDHTFNDQTLSTIGVDFKIVPITINNVTHRLQLWDTSGVERFRSVTTAYYRGASCILLIYAIDNHQSFENIEGYFQQAKTANPDAIYALVGAKSDTTERKVTEIEAQEWARQRNILFFQTSAKSNTQIDTLMTKVSQQCLKKIVLIPRVRPPIEARQLNRWRGPAAENLEREDFNRKQQKVEKLEYYAPIAILILLLLLVASGLI